MTPVGFLADSANKPNKPIIPSMKNKSLNRIALLWLIAGVALSHAQPWRSSLYPENWTPPLGLSFAKDQMIQDFSYAGYRRGEVEIPSPERHVLNAVRARRLTDM